MECLLCGCLCGGKKDKLRRGLNLCLEVKINKMKIKINKIYDYCKQDFITTNEKRVTCSPKCSRLRQQEYRNRPEVKAKQQEYRNRPEVKAYQKKYLQEHKEELREYKKQWVRKNKEKKQ